MKERVIPVSKLSNKELKEVIKKNNLTLTVFELRKISKILGRDPTLPEVWIFNVEWSEHCSYKSSRRILKKYLPTKAPNVILGPVEDAGIIRLFNEWCVVIAHESHNHPSQVLPVEGAATGIGGIVRDVDCMGARVIATADPLRFGNPYGKNRDRTRWIAQGVVDGIWEYSNALGIPNVGGDVVFADCFDDNCLVNVIALGIVKENEIIHSCVPEEAKKEPYDIILIGKPTDDSGFGGAAFASEILDEKQERRGAVQVHDPFLKNVLLMGKANAAVFNEARKNNIRIGFKDLGGGGLACASSELGASSSFGMEIDLDKLPQALKNLLPEVLLCAETQERYILTCPRRFTNRVLKIYNKEWELPHIYEGAKAAVIGEVRKDNRYIVKHKGKIVVDCPIEEITRGISYIRRAKKKVWEEKEPQFEIPPDLNKVLLKILSTPNIASKEYIYRFYDTEVQGNAVIRPGEADAGVLRPIPDEKVAIALATDNNPFYGRISPYWGAACAVAEAMRNVASVGATPACLTDCLNFGNPENPEVFYEFVESVRGIADCAKNLYLKGYKNTPVPVVSGNVSFYNESATGSAVYPSPIICCVGILQDYSKAITMQLKQPYNKLFLVGCRYDELGGSEYYREIINCFGCNVPIVRYELERGMLYGVIDCINEGLLSSCHDISNGGMIVTICEMIFGGYTENTKGAVIKIQDGISEPEDLRIDKILFSESSGFIIETAFSERVKEIFKMYNIEIKEIGYVTKEKRLKVYHKDKKIIDLNINKLKNVWQNSLSKALK